MKGDHIEIALHHHRLIGAADRIGGAVEAKEVPPLLKHLGLRGVEVLRLGPIEAAATEADHPALPVADRHHHPLPEAVVVAVAPLTGHHKACRLKQFRLQSLHLLQMAQQAIPALRRIAELEGFQGGLVEPALVAQIGQGCSSLR